jgi:ribonuclease P protein component
VLNSIKKNSDFLKVYHNGKSYANKYLVMYVLRNNSEENRFGITVSKKVGNSVVRHRVTRLIRESIRLNLEQFEKGFDIVIVARNTAKGRKCFEIESALLHLGRLHKIMVR